MHLAIFAIAPTVFAVTLPFLFPYTQPPSTNFWPLVTAWLCGWGICATWFLHTVSRTPSVTETVAGEVRNLELPTLTSTGLLLAALLASAIGLLQYFDLAAGLDPWVHASRPGQAMGNLRQRNQQATLLSMGVWALLWVVAQTQANALVGQRWRTPGAEARQNGLQWSMVLVGLLTAWALALLAVGSAATASRTGLAQWLVILVLLACWRASLGRAALVLSLAGFVIYGMAGWLLPDLLRQWTGFQADGLFARFGDAPGCTSRRVLWSNVLYLIAQKPWLGWGWGELDYAHYITLFPGPRFCVLLDNAHNLPLHLAVELGVPVAALACIAVLAWVWRARPWREQDPARQLAWGILALVGLHSMLEFPLWYGPFQLVTVLAVCILWRRSATAGPQRAGAGGAGGLPGAARVLLAIVALAALAYASWDYHRVSQAFRPMQERSPALREDTLRKVAGTRLFADAVDFAVLTTTPVNPATAARVHALATALLHYSPEPRVIEPLIESATLLGLDDEAAFHLLRYRAAYPADHARWSARNRAASAPE